jgi:uncharacterized protein YndB with AHSA1/START domain
MKILKIILIVIAILIVVILVVALFVKEEYSVEREVTINKPKQIVFDYIKLLKNQNNYSKWVMMDPNVKQEYKGTDGTVGFVSAWDSENKNVGKGEQEITKITEGERIELEIRFIKPFEGKAVAYLTTEPISEMQTKVKWGFNSKMKYPMNILLLCMSMDKMVGNDLATGLTNLKSVLEK